MGSYCFRLNGADLEAHPAGILWWPSRRLLAVADLHLEKASAYALHGVFLPPYDSAATIIRLATVCAALNPARVVAMGDSFHDDEAEGRLDPGVADVLTGVVQQCEWIWLAGNHDPLPPAALEGLVREEWREGPLVFRHEPNAREPGEVAGHLHPKIRISRRGQSVGARCFVTDGSQLVMPAFGALTGGLSARDPDVRRLFRSRAFALMLGPEKVHPVKL